MADIISKLSSKILIKLISNSYLKTEWISNKAHERNIELINIRNKIINSMSFINHIKYINIFDWEIHNVIKNSLRSKHLKLKIKYLLEQINALSNVNFLNTYLLNLEIKMKSVVAENYLYLSPKLWVEYEFNNYENTASRLFVLYAIIITVEPILDYN